MSEPRRVRHACTKLIAHLAIGLAAACSTRSTIRVRDGRAFDERPIDPKCYAAYIRARLYESKGDWATAAAKYRDVLSNDPNASEALVRLGAIYCTTAYAKSAALWERAERIDSENPKLWLERARCELKRSDLQSSFRDAQQAIRLAPRSEDAVALLLSACNRLGQPEAGLRWLRGALAMNPHNVRLWQLLFQSEHASPSQRLHAATRITQLRPLSGAEVPATFRSGSAAPSLERQAWKVVLARALDDALRRADVDAARRSALLLGVNPELLAQLADASGSYAIALSQANMLLGVDPDNYSMWIIGLFAADALRDDEQFAKLLARAPRTSLPTESRMKEPLIDLLRRRSAFEIEQPPANGARPSHAGNIMSNGAILSRLQ